MYEMVKVVYEERNSRLQGKSSKPPEGNGDKPLKGNEGDGNKPPPCIKKNQISMDAIGVLHLHHEEF